MDKSIEAAAMAIREVIDGLGTYEKAARAAIAAYRDAEIERLNENIKTLLANHQNVRAKLEASNKELREIAESINDPRVNLTMTAAEWCTEVQAKLAEAERDAERYRWLRGRSPQDYCINCGYDALSLIVGDDLDKEIDAARGGERG